MMISDELIQFIKEHQNDDLSALLLKKKRYPKIDLSFVVQQIEGRKKAQKKLPEIAAIKSFIFPVKESMEQCSSELTAKYKASLVKGESIADLTGGLGVDSFYFAESYKQVAYIERNKLLSEIATHNFLATNKHHIVVHNMEAADFLKNCNSTFDCIYIDPSRRNQSKSKVFLFNDCEPDILQLKTLLFGHSSTILIKASPFLDIKQAVQELGGVERVHIVSIKNECKELLFEWTGKEKPLEIICCQLSNKEVSKKFRFLLNQEETATIKYTSEVLTYLYEPNVSILKSGGYKLFGNQYPIAKLHPNSHLYTSHEQIDSFFGNCFRVEKVFSLNKKESKAWIPKDKANVIVRNFPMNTNEIKKRFKLQDGGEIFLIFTTLYSGEKVGIRASKVNPD